MLQINSKRETKLVEIDGHGYSVRKPGAGEALTLQASGRKLETLSKAKTLSGTQSDEVDELSNTLLGICLNLYDGLDEDANKYLPTLDVETLIEAMNALFNPTQDEQRATEQAETTPANA